MQTRPPIVTVLGHVDHGKTTLLDAIRKTSVAAREAGGITQRIGASEVVTKEGKRITFIDTPGHAAFSKMRSRGAKVADVAILVVDASDGVKPQTQESLSILKEAKIPFVVAITKIDLPSADIEGTRGQLEKAQVSFEGRGGDTPVVALSAKTGKGLNELLETISLLAEVHEIKSEPAATLEAPIIETSKDKRGQLVSVVVRAGTLRVSDTVSADGISCKVKGLFNYKGERIKEALPGEPAQILGFEKLPEVGSTITTGGASAKEKAKLSHEKKIEKEEVPIFLKAKNAGSLEAIIAGIPAGIGVIASGVGDVTESDVLDAKASGAFIFAFESQVSSSVQKLAESESVHIERFEIIYELFQKLEELVKKGKVEVLGKAEIIAEFPYEGKKVAGCKVKEGRVSKVDRLIVMRGQKEIGAVRTISMKKQKQDIVEAKAGEEFGVIFEPQLDFKIGDMLVSVAK